MATKNKAQKLADLRREDPKENNWEIEDNAECAENAECGMRNAESADFEQQAPDPAPAPVAVQTDFDILQDALEVVDIAIRKDNPVWKFTVKEKEVIIVFKSGQKVRVPRR